MNYRLFLFLFLLPFLTGCSAIGFKMDRAKDREIMQETEIPLDSLRVYEERTFVAFVLASDSTITGYVDAIQQGEYVDLRDSWIPPSAHVERVDWSSIERVTLYTQPEPRSRMGFYLGYMVDATVGTAATFALTVLAIALTLEALL